MERRRTGTILTDWLADTQLRACSVMARGLWMDCLCLMHQAKPYGHLLINGRDANPTDLAGLIGSSAKKVARLLDELLSNGVASVNDEGIIYSPRMVRDEQQRGRDADRQRHARDKSVTRGVTTDGQERDKPVTRVRAKTKTLNTNTNTEILSTNRKKKNTPIRAPRARFDRWNAEFPRKNSPTAPQKRLAY